jgi:hypothetical protein
MLHAGREVAGRQVEGPGMQHVACADPACLLGDLGGEPAPRPPAAQHLLGADRPAEAGDHVAGRHAELLQPAHARPNAVDGHAEPLELLGEIRRRPRPRLQIARITEHTGDGHALKAQCASVSVEGGVHVGP